MSSMFKHFMFLPLSEYSFQIFFSTFPFKYLNISDRLPLWPTMHLVASLTWTTQLSDKDFLRLGNTQIFLRQLYVYVIKWASLPHLDN